MNEVLELEPSDKALVIFDGRFLYIFRNRTDENIMPAKGITDITITTGWSGMINFKNRFTSDVGLDYDKDRLPEIQHFVDQVLEAVRGGQVA